MTEAQIRQRVRLAADKAFGAGLRHARKPVGGEEDARQAAMSYAEGLVMPTVDTAIAEAVEQGATAVLRERGAAA